MSVDLQINARELKLSVKSVRATNKVIILLFSKEQEQLNFLLVFFFIKKLILLWIHSNLSRFESDECSWALLLKYELLSSLKREKTSISIIEKNQFSNQ